MKATVEKVEGNQALLEVEVGESELDKALDRAYRKVVGRINIPGFRKGKAPRIIVERFVGKEPLYEEALDLLVPEAYEQAVQETGIKPIDRPQITITQIEQGKPLTFKASVEVKPEVTLGPVEDLEVEKPSGELPAEEVERRVEEEIHLRRQRRAELCALGEDAELRDGLWALVDFQGTMDGKPMKNGSAEGFTVEIGGGKMVPGFEAQLVGARVGEEREIRVTFPEDYEAQELAGEEATFQVKVREIKEKVLPELTDEFAREASPYGSLQELRSELANKLRDASLQDAERAFQRAVVEAVSAQAEVTLPEVLVQRRLDRLMEENQASFKQYGIDYEEFLRNQGTDLESVREQLRPRAEKEVKADLVLDAVATAEGFEASDEEVEAEIQRVAGEYGQSAEAVKKLMLDRENLYAVRQNIIIRKAIEHLGNRVKVKPVPLGKLEEAAAETGDTDGSDQPQE